MSRFVLIHGAWHGAWCWYKLIPLLQHQGHEVIAPDLPGHGIDCTPTNRVSLKSYTDCICAILDESPEPAILLGHSMGGIPITQAAEYRPDRIRMLVYLAAFLLPDGMSLFDEAQTHGDSLVPPNMVFDESDPSYVGFRKEAMREAFYEDCADADVTLAGLLATRQPQSPLMTRLQTTPQNFGRVPRFYVEALEDRAITAAVQKKMYSTLPCQDIITLESSHSPFFSQPERLAGHLLALAEAE